MNGISSQVATVDYLQLLTVQLQNQDPIDPVDQEGLINDLTQFSMLEGIENLNATFSEVLKIQELSQGAGLVGKNIHYRDITDGSIRSGVATELFNLSDGLSVLVDGTSVSLDNIIGVSIS